MALMNFLKPKNKLEEGGRCSVPVMQDEGEPEQKCPNCHREIPLSRLMADNMVCGCGYHFRMRAGQRIKLIADEGSFVEMYKDVRADNPLGFPGYDEKLDAVRAASSQTEAVICGTVRIGGCHCCIFVMDAYFMMGSMGSAVGEKLTRLFEYAAWKHLAVVGFTVSGGARMQEGILSLMQMAKTSGAVKRHSDAGNLYITVLTDPTTGGVTASFAMEGDIILAEPDCLVAFAGPRVIEQTIRQKLPKDFQTSEFVLQKGFIDSVVSRNNLKSTLVKLLKLHGYSGEEA